MAAGCARSPPSKPLTPVAGVPLIAHVIEAARRPGRRASSSSPAMRRSGSKRSSPGSPVPVELRPARGLGPAQRPFGAGRAARIAGDYLLMMSDHLFDPAIARRADRRRPATGAALTLAVDRDWRRESLDLDDATKVARRRRADRRDRQDAGAVRRGRHRHLPRHARACGRDPRGGGGRQAGSLSEGVQQLADAGQARRGRHRPVLAGRRRPGRAGQGRGAVRYG